MAKMKLIEALKAVKQSSFKFVRFTKQYDSNNNMIAVLELEEPIPFVSGSQNITVGDITEKLDAYDVMVVKVHQDDMDNEGITVNDDGSGEVSCDLRLDVTKSGEVWLKTKSFAVSGREFGNSRRNEQQQSVVEKLRLAKAAAAKKIIGQPGATVSAKELEPVDNG